MNLLEHYIEEVISIEDVTNHYEEVIKDLNEPIYKIKMIVDCYGRKERVEVEWLKSRYETNIQRGYFLA